MDRKRVIGEVAARHGVRLEEDDPAFLLVTIAEIALRDAQAEFVEAVRKSVADQAEAAERTQKTIGETLGNSIRRAVSEGSRVVPPCPVQPRWQADYFRALFWLLIFAIGFTVSVRRWPC